MGYLPIFLDVTGRKCVVVGGGEVAARKVESLLEAGAQVTVVSPELGPSSAALAERGAFIHLNRDYKRGDMRHSVLVYAATDDRKLHRELAAEAAELRIPLNVADDPELCSFIAPAVVKQGLLQVAVSTTGASPAFAARLRRSLAAQFGTEYAAAIQILRAARVRLRAQNLPQSERSRRLKALAESELTDVIRIGDLGILERMLREHLGEEASLEALGIERATLNIAGDIAASQ
jgi:precorrin-2 dehydrogenase/sirohydrochlorin ferrochelatase